MTESATLLLRPIEVARELGISRTKTYELLAAGQLPVVKIGGSMRVPRTALVEWIESNTKKAV